LKKLPIAFEEKKNYVYVGPRFVELSDEVYEHLCNCFGRYGTDWHFASPNTIMHHVGKSNTVWKIDLK
jgi:hypothetical protein